MNLENRVNDLLDEKPIRRLPEDDQDSRLGLQKASIISRVAYRPTN